MIGAARQLLGILPTLLFAGCVTGATSIPASQPAGSPSQSASALTQPPTPTLEPSAIAGDHCSRWEEYQLAYAVEGMEDVEVRCDLAYKELGETTLTFDLYLPPGMEVGAALPVVVLVHGNIVDDPLYTIRYDAKRTMYTNGLVLAAQGIAAVAPNYRGYNESNEKWLRDAEQDVIDLLAYLPGYADELAIDASRTCLWTSSGGGVPGAWAALNGAPRPRCAVVFSGSLDVALLPDLSPVAHVTSDMPPFLVVNGASDFWANAGARPFLERAARIGAPVTVSQHPGGHGWEQLDDARSRELTAEALEFLAQHLGVS